MATEREGVMTALHEEPWTKTNREANKLSLTANQLATRAEFVQTEANETDRQFIAAVAVVCCFVIFRQLTRSPKRKMLQNSDPGISANDVYVICVVALTMVSCALASIIPCIMELLLTDNDERPRFWIFSPEGALDNKGSCI
jgi:hypothetical protein